MARLCALHPPGQFRSELDAFRFGNGVLLRSLEAAESKSFLNWFGVPAWSDLGFRRMGLYAEEALTTAGDSDYDLYEKVRDVSFDSLAAVICAMRLVKTGGVYTAARVAWIEPADSIGDRHWLPIRRTLGRHSDDEPAYELKANDVPMIYAVLSRLDSVAGNVRVAIDRFVSLGERGSAADRIIDLCIAMEALFGDAGDAISYKVCLRMARYIGRNPFRRRQVFNFMRTTYAVRSSIVHGEGGVTIQKRLSRRSPSGHGKYGFQSLNECARETEQFVRACLRKAVLEGKPNLDDLDMEAVGEGSDDGNPSRDIR